MRVAVFTARSCGTGTAIALLVAAAFRLLDAPWSLAVANGLATCALVLIVPVARRLGRLKMESRAPSIPPWQGVWMVGYATMSVPLYFVFMSFELDVSHGVALASLFGLVAVVSWTCGDIVATLDHRQRGAGADGPTPPEGESTN